MKKIVMVVMCVAVAVMTAGVARAAEGAADGKGEGKKAHKGADFFAKADADKDGKLSLAEYKAVNTKPDAEAKFAAADTDKDGFLTPEELKAARAQHKKADKAKDAVAKPAEAPAAPEVK